MCFLEYNEYMYLREFKILINKINVLYSKLKIREKYKWNSPFYIKIF